MPLNGASNPTPPPIGFDLLIEYSPGEEGVRASGARRRRRPNLAAGVHLLEVERAYGLLHQSDAGDLRPL